MNAGGVIEAVVQVGEAETRYLRCGRGSRVVLVLAIESSLRMDLLQRFGESACVIAPLMEVPGADAARLHDWLCGLIEGLGVARPEVVLCPSLRALAPALSAQAGELFDVLPPPVASVG